jgi:hypothetical protein
MKKQKAKIGVKDLKARKDVKGGNYRPQNPPYLKGPSQPVAFGGQYNRSQGSNSNQQY